MGPRKMPCTSVVQLLFALFVVLCLISAAAPEQSDVENAAEQDVPDNAENKRSSSMESDKKAVKKDVNPSDELIGTKQDKRSPIARLMKSNDDDKRSPYAGFMGPNKRSPYAKFMGSSEDKRSPYASFMGSNDEEKRSPIAKLMGSNDKRSPYAKFMGSSEDKRSPYAKFMTDDERSPYANFMGSNDDEEKRSPIAKLMGSKDDKRLAYAVHPAAFHKFRAGKRSPYASFMGSNDEEKRSPIAKLMGSSDDKRLAYAVHPAAFHKFRGGKRSPYASFMGSNDDKRSPYANFMSDSSDDKRSPYAGFLASNSEDKRSPYAGFMTGDKRSPYAKFMTGDEEKRSPYAKFMGSSEDKRSPYAKFMGSNEEKRSPYAQFMGSNEEKRSPYAKFMGSSEDKRSPYANFMAGDKRSPYAKFLNEDKRSPYGAYMGMMSDDKRSPYAKYMYNENDKRSPGFRTMRLGSNPRSIYDVQRDDTANIARGLRGPSMEQLSDNGLVQTIDGLKETDKLSDKRIPTDEDVLLKSQEDPINLPPAMMQALLKPGENEVKKDEQNHGRQKRSALVYDEDKRTPYAGFREIMARNRELPVSRLNPAPGFKRTFETLNDISDRMGSDGMLWSDSYSIPRFTGSFRKRRSTDEVHREKRSPGFRSMKPNWPDFDDMDKRSPGFRFMKWQSGQDDEDMGAKRSPGFRHMRLRDNGSNSRYRNSYFLDALANELEEDKRGAGFRSMRIQPDNFEELDSDDMIDNDITKRYFGGSNRFLHPAAFHRQLAFSHRRYRG